MFLLKLKLQWPNYCSNTGSDCCFMCLVDRTKHYPPPLIINPASSLWQPITGCIVSQLKLERSCREFTCLQTINSGIVKALSSLSFSVETFSSSMFVHLLTLHSNFCLLFFLGILAGMFLKRCFMLNQFKTKRHL